MSSPLPRLAQDEMIWVPGGTFAMGSDRHYPEEAPVHRVTVDGFWMDPAPVTNRQFREFVEATGYVTFAEIAPGRQRLSRCSAAYVESGIACLPAAADLCRAARLEPVVEFRFGANWRRPYGRAAPIKGLEDHPVVHIAFRMPRLMRHGRASNCRPKPNGNSPPAAALEGPNSPGAMNWPRAGQQMANTWQGDFPHENTHAMATSARRLWHASRRMRRPLRHDRQCMGVDVRLVRFQARQPTHRKPAASRKIPAAVHLRAKLRSLQPQIKDSAKGTEGRLASVRTELLPALSASGSPSRARRHVSEPRRVPMHHPKLNTAKTNCDTGVGHVI